MRWQIDFTQNIERWIATSSLSMDDLVPGFHSVRIGTLHHITSESIFYMTYLHPLSSNLLLAMQIILSVITGAQKHRGFGFLRSCSFSQTCHNGNCFCTCSYAHNSGFVVIHRMWWYVSWSCPCHDKFWHEECVCADRNSCFCELGWICLLWQCTGELVLKIYEGIRDECFGQIWRVVMKRARCW